MVMADSAVQVRFICNSLEFSLKGLSILDTDKVFNSWLYPGTQNFQQNKSFLCLTLLKINKKKKKVKKAPGRFELPISCLLDRRFNQLSHGAASYYDNKVEKKNLQILNRSAEKG